MIYEKAEKIKCFVPGKEREFVSMASEMGSEDQGSQETLENATPLATRVSTVIMGRMGFTSVLLRLIGMELYKFRRRLMSKVLCTIAVVLALLVPLAVGVELVISLSTPASQFAPACQSTSESAPAPGCTPFSSIAAESIKQAAISALSEPLRLPSALEMATTQGELNPAIILVVILVGSIAGGELSIGTVRLMFTRGPWRGQFLLAKYGAALVCVVLGVLVMALSGVVLGQLFNLVSGVHQSTALFTADWLGHAVLYLLATMLNWFMYAVVAVFFAFLGRSTVAGIVGALTWFFAEPIISSILTVAGNFSVGLFGAFMRALPDYLMGNNARALQLNQAQYLFGGTGSSQSNLQALITLAVYLVAFIGLTWWLNESRDVTN
jgi:ABC-type transport system involved in multi-copper enzyme maturation permease subunit